MPKVSKYLVFTTIIAAVLMPALGLALEVDFPEFEGVKPEDSFGPANWIRYLFLLGLGVVGLAVIASLVWAGVQWMTAGDNASKIDEARDRIKGAVLGLIVLMGSYIFLRTINPQLVNLRNPVINLNIGGLNYCAFAKTEDCESPPAAPQECSPPGENEAVCGIAKFCTGDNTCVPKRPAGSSCTAATAYTCLSKRCDVEEGETSGTCEKSLTNEPCLANSDCESPLISSCVVPAGSSDNIKKCRD